MMAALVEQLARHLQEQVAQAADDGDARDVHEDLRPLETEGPKLWELPKKKA